MVTTITTTTNTTIHTTSSHITTYYTSNLNYYIGPAYRPRVITTTGNTITVLLTLL